MAAKPPLDPWLRDILRCPRCQGTLDDATGPGGEPELWCCGTAADPSCRLQFRIDGTVPVLLVDEARDPGS